MNLNYYPETDSLYMDLSEKASAESKEISKGIVLDYDAEGNLVGIDIDNASKKFNLKSLQPIASRNTRTSKLVELEGTD